MPSAQGHITVRRRPKDGNDGSDAVRYWVVPSVTSISKSNSGTFTPSSVTLSVMRQIGSAAASTITTLFVRYKLTYTNSLTMNWQQLTNGSSIAVSGYARSVEIELYMTGSVTAGVAYGSGACLDRVSIPVVIDGNDGDQGVQGLQGCIYRRSRFATGFQYRNDSALTTTGLRYIDLVYLMTNSSIFASKAKWFRCKKTHTSTSANAPQLTSNGTEAWLKYWEPLNSLEPTYTPFLMADDAIITLMQSNQLLIEDSNGVITAGLSGSNSGKKIRIWAGSATPDNAPFRVDVIGALVATKADITGTINADSGRIAGFNISGNSLTNGPEFNNDACIIFRNDAHKCFAGIGGNVLPSASGVRGVARFENYDESDWWGLGHNYALLVGARGASDNSAIAISGGYISGLALKTETIGFDTVTAATKPTTVNKTLGRDTNSLYVTTQFEWRSSSSGTYATNTREVKVTLPAMEPYDDGHVLFVKRGLNDGNYVKILPGASYRMVYNSSTNKWVRTYGTSCILYDNNSIGTSGNPMSIKSEGDAMCLIYHRDLAITQGSVTYHGVWVQHKFPREW